MADKASIFQAVQIGVESVAGTAVAANKKLLGVSMDLQPKSSGDAFRAMGNKYASFVTVNKEWSEIGVSGKLSFNEILYLLSSLFYAPSPAQQGATAAYKWTIDPATSAADAGKTFTIENGDATTAWKVAGARVTGLTFTFNRNEVSFSGSMLAGALTTGVTLTAAPTAIMPVPVLPTYVSFYVADTQAGLAGATALTRSFSLTFGVTDKVGLFWPVGQNPGTTEKEPKVEGRIRLMSDADGIAFITAVRASTTKWIRVKAVGPLIASTYYNTFQVDFPCQVQEIGGFSDEDGIHVAEFGLTPVHDATWTKAMSFEVTAALQTL